jgi:23S rRNA (pseudouridine1915-N3)-methyltransferase
MNAVILVVGRLKEDWQRAACQEYLKRLTRYGSFEVAEVPDQPEPEKASEAQIQQILEKEGRELLRRIRPEDRVVALAIQGTAPDSVGLSQMLSGWSDGRRLVLVIGGSLGLSPEVLKRADAKLSFSNLTFPHTLMRVILLEQLYRSCKILSGQRYHK